jgi:hypothetical protein
MSVRGECSVMEAGIITDPGSIIAIVGFHTYEQIAGADPKWNIQLEDVPTCGVEGISALFDHSGSGGEVFPGPAYIVKRCEGRSSGPNLVRNGCGAGLSHIPAYVCDKVTQSYLSISVK